ncbi:MAG: hypothetical protein KDK41_15035 [Leptospiraceae bacterium]|nr:hypothetical protein [Leptospiraceae bacterium]
MRDLNQINMGLLALAQMRTVVAWHGVLENTAVPIWKKCIEMIAAELPQLHMQKKKELQETFDLLEPIYRLIAPFRNEIRGIDEEDVVASTAVKFFDALETYLAEIEDVLHPELISSFSAEVWSRD